MRRKKKLDNSQRPQKILIVHLIESLRVGGAEVALLHYIQALGNVEYIHLVYSFGQDGPIRKKIEQMGIRVHFGPQMSSIKNPIRFASSLFALVRDVLRFLERYDVNVIQSHLILPNQLAVFVGKLSGVPAFPTVHSTNSFEDARSRFDPRVYLRRIVNATTYRMADSVVAVSSAVKDSVCSSFGLKESKVIIVKNGIIPPEFSSGTRLIEKEFPDVSTLKVVSVGRLVPLKSFDLLIKAIAQLIDSGHKDFVVLIVGGGAEKSVLERLILELSVQDYVKLLGERDDVLQLMGEADLFVLPSRYEGLSIAMIEAMACGLSLIVSDVPGLGDCITHENNGLLFEPGDSAALAGCLIQLANDQKLRETLAQNARESFNMEYNMYRNIEALKELIDRYVSRPVESNKL